MKILLCSYAFEPNVGGIETVSKLLASGFAAAGHTVTVVTKTPGASGFEHGYEVVRRPNLHGLWRLAKAADLIFQNNISLQLLWPMMFAGKPVVITHQTWLTDLDGEPRGWEDRVKLALLTRITNVSISEAIASSLPVRSIVIGNPFEWQEFSKFASAPKVKDIVFMGRLVSDKGCDLLLKAVAKLGAYGLSPNLTVIGDGPERAALTSTAKQLGLGDRVTFLGSVGSGRGEVVGQHKVLAIPSLWAEPFGIVALEGIAAGCAVVASEDGGLPEATGPCGLFFKNGDVEMLTAALHDLLSSESRRVSLTSARSTHLSRFDPSFVVRKYLELFKTLCADR